MSPKEAHDEVFGGSRNRLNKTPLKRAREGFENGTPEMQATTARLFRDDHWTMVNTSKNGDCYAHGKRVNWWDGTATAVREVQLSSGEEGAVQYTRSVRRFITNRGTRCRTTTV